MRRKVKIKVSDYEYRIIVNSLLALRNKLITEDKDDSPVSELLLKIIK